MRKCRVFFLFSFFILVFLGTYFYASAPPVFSANLPGTTYRPKEVQPIAKVLIKRIIVTGNTLISTQAIRAIVSSYEGQELSFEDATKIAARITGAYREKGYFLAYAYVPPQRIVNGVLRMGIVEGKVGQIRVEGNKHYSTAFILNNFKTAIQDGTLQYDALQKAVLLLNENTDLHAQIVLLAGTAPGTTNVVLKIRDELPVHLVGDYNNFGNPTSGEHQPSANFLFGNLGVEGSALNATTLWSFPNGSTSFQTPIVLASYAVPVNNHGTKVTASYSSADVRLGGALYSALGVIGETNITSIGLSNPIARAADHSSNFTSTFYIKSSHNFTLNQLTSRDKIRSIAFGYDTNWISGRASNSISATVTEGLGTLLGGMPNNTGALNGTPFGASTAFAGNKFLKLNVNVNRYQSIGSHGDLLILKVASQFAFNPLVLAEQFIMGGSESVRGYRTAEVNTDSGVSGTVEFRFPLIDRPGTNLQFGIFTDMGRGNSFNNAGAPNPGVHHLAGYGFGFRASIGDSTALRADFGFPIDPLPRQDTNSNATRESMVPYFEASTKFF